MVMPALVSYHRAMVTVGAHALVTGGSSGIGLAIAMELSRLGCHVHIVARRMDALDGARRTISAARLNATQQIRAYSHDVSSRSDVAALFDALRAQHAEPGIVVNSAGVTRPGHFEDIPVEQFEQLMQVNYMGTVHVLKEAVPRMKARGAGYIINIGSMAALVGVFGLSAYSASKFAVRGLTACLRSELKPHGIVVSLLCPPDTDTPMRAAEAISTPDETGALAATARVLTAGQVAQAALRGMRRRQAVIVPGLESRLTAAAERLVPSLVEGVSDRIVRQTQHRLRH
jgi:3-dehydrosphinganine reductase